MRVCLIFLVVVCLAHVLSARDINILDLGADPEGIALCTDLIQKAVDDCSASGGGTVTVPAGKFLTGTIILKSNVNLYLQNGAVLMGSTDMADYKGRNLIRAVNAINISITGSGTIDGQGSAFWIPADTTAVPYSRAPGFTHKRPSPDMLIVLDGCENVLVENVTLTGAESWTLHLLGCGNVVVSGIKIRNPLHGPNTDGIDIQACSNVRISNCDIYTRDDAIVLKNRSSKYPGKPNENITVTNCTITTLCNAFKIGTETMGDFKNIVFSNSIINAAKPEDDLAKVAATYVDPDNYHIALAPSGGIALETVDGANLQGISITNIVMEGVWTPIFIRLANRGAGRRQAVPPVPGSLKDIVISNIVAYGASIASSITAIPGYYVENVLLDNIMIKTQGGGSRELSHKILDEKIDAYPDAKMWGAMPVSGFFVRHVKELQMNNIRIIVGDNDMRPLMSFDDVMGLYLNNVQTNDVHTGDCILKFNNVRSARIFDIDFQSASKTPWLFLEGDQTGNIMVRPAGKVPGKDMIQTGTRVGSDAVEIL